VLAQIRKAVNNPFDFRNFYILFIVAVVLLLIPIIIISFVARSSMICKPYRVDLKGDLSSGERKIHEFNYSGSNSCKVAILPKLSSGRALSLWIYKPNNDIEVIDISNSKNNSELITTGSSNGRYRVSIQNKSALRATYQLIIGVIEKYK